MPEEIFEVIERRQSASLMFVEMQPQRIEETTGKFDKIRALVIGMTQRPGGMTRSDPAAMRDQVGTKLASTAEAQYCAVGIGLGTPTITECFRTQVGIEK